MPNSHQIYTKSVTKFFEHGSDPPSTPTMPKTNMLKVMMTMQMSMKQIAFTIFATILCLPLYRTVLNDLMGWDSREKLDMLA